MFNLQENMEIGNEVALMPGCNHCFHNECVLKWFNLQSWCPVCRTKILPDEHEHGDMCESEDLNNNKSISEKTCTSHLDHDHDYATHPTGVKSNNLGPMFEGLAVENDRIENVN